MIEYIQHLNINTNIQRYGLLSVPGKRGTDNGRKNEECKLVGFENQKKKVGHLVWHVKRIISSITGTLEKLFPAKVTLNTFYYSPVHEKAHSSTRPSWNDQGFQKCAVYKISAWRVFFTNPTPTDRKRLLESHNYQPLLVSRTITAFLTFRATVLAIFDF